MKKVIYPFVGIFIFGLLLGCKQETVTRSPMQYDQTKAGTSTTIPTPMTTPKKK